MDTTVKRGRGRPALTQEEKDKRQLCRDKIKEFEAKETLTDEEKTQLRRFRRFLLPKKSHKRLVHVNMNSVTEKKNDNMTIVHNTNISDFVLTNILNKIGQVKKFYYICFER